MSNNLIDRVDEVLRRMSEDERSSLVDAIVYEAGKFWLRAGCLYDFGLQSCNGTSIVFGGTNRVIWNPHGFRVDKSYCSSNFLEKNKEYL